MPEFERILGLDELAEGARKSITIDDCPALVFRAGGQYYAVEDLCTHDGQPLTDGPFDGETVMCPRHGGRFHVKTGKAVTMPAVQAIRTFETSIRADGVYVKIED